MKNVEARCGKCDNVFITSEDTPSLFCINCQDESGIKVGDASSNFHPGIQHVLQYFKYKHLPKNLQIVSKPFCDLAYLTARGSSNPETTVALRKLLEAKDAAVRAVLSEESV